MKREKPSQALPRTLMYFLTATSGVVAGAAILFSEITTVDTSGAVFFLGVCSLMFGGLAYYMGSTLEDE